MLFDVIIVGGGPAGLTAALYTQRNGKKALVIEKETFGGQITHSPKIENYPGIGQISGNAFAEQLLDQVLNQGAQIEIDNVIHVEDKGETKLVHTEMGMTFESRTVILATGVHHRMLGLNGEAELIGEGISFCAVCDGDFYSNRSVCVAGGGNSALQEALLLADKCSHVTILQDLPRFTGETPLLEALKVRENVQLMTGVRIVGFEKKNGVLTGVQIIRDTVSTVVPCDGLFIAIGLIPNNDAFSSIAKLNEAGYFDSDESCLTTTPGIFVAGDCRQKYIRQITTASADGAVAALAACRYLSM